MAVLHADGYHSTMDESFGIKCAVLCQVSNRQRLAAVGFVMMLTLQISVYWLAYAVPVILNLCVLQVEEVTFINLMSNEGRKKSLQQRLEEGEQRRHEALAAILAKQQVSVG